MNRNEKTGRFEAGEKEAEGYGYYSKVLNKPFDTLDELKEAEVTHAKQEEEKKALALQKKAEASKVEDAWKSLNAAKKAYNEKVSSAQKEANRKKSEAIEAYNQAVREYGEAVQAENVQLEDAERAYHQALSEFTKAHPEGYHVTLKDGDNTKTISRNVVSVDPWLDAFFRPFDSFFDSFKKNF